MPDPLTYFQKGYDDTCKILAGDGPAHYCADEAKCLGHYGMKLGRLLRAGDLLGTALDDGERVFAAGYPDGAEYAQGRSHGVVGNSLSLQEALDELDWEKL